MWHSLEILIYNLAILPGYNFQVYPLINLLFLLYISILYSYRSANSRRYLKIKMEAFYPFRSFRFIFLLSKSFDFYPCRKEEKGFFLLSKPTNARYLEYSYIF